MDDLRDKHIVVTGATGPLGEAVCALALASGANFVARAFSGDPNGTAEIIADAIRTPGFSFVEILSPCVTFRPEQRDWRKIVRPAPVAPTDDAVLASRRLLSDDGLTSACCIAATGRSTRRRSARQAWRLQTSRKGSHCE